MMKSLTHSIHFAFAIGFGLSLLVATGQSEAKANERHTIVIDGKFDDWKEIKTGVTDPADDVIDTDGREADHKPEPRDHEDVDILEFKVTHDADNLYCYIRTKGVIGRTQKGKEAKNEKGYIPDAGRYYITVAIDVDNDDETGYWLHEGGTLPTSPGYD
ncbi:MAG: hypothetical protein KDA65_14630, partial [Planctomycetaceae bacterium]|nr:hypothetical protein [Planctomycetaceae bacterium]